MRDIAKDASDRAIVCTIITMAQSLNLDVIAEGVELESQMTFLENSRCHHFQGYLYSKPLPIEECHAYLKKISER